MKDEIEVAAKKQVLKRKTKTERWLYDRALNHEEEKRKVVQPGLLRVNKQLRREGLPFFFQLRQFEFNLRDSPGGWLCFMKWMDAIGSTGQNNLRSLTLHIWVQTAEKLQDQLVNTIHTRLSEHATVSYKSWQAHQMWKLGLLFHEMNGTKYPKLLGEVSDDNFQTMGFTHDYGLGYVGRSARQVDCSTHVALIFEPKMGWFGAAASQAAPAG